MLLLSLRLLLLLNIFGRLLLLVRGLLLLSLLLLAIEQAQAAELHIDRSLGSAV